MKILIIDNGSRLLDNIVRLVDMRYKYRVISYNPDISLSDNGYDGIILSGGMRHEVEDRLPDNTPYFRQEFDLIRHTNKPVMGICLGHQMVNVAFGGSLFQLDDMVHYDAMNLPLTETAQTIFGTTEISVHEHHQWIVQDIGDNLHVIATSPYGIEMMQHGSRPVITTQFHPEFDSTDNSVFWDVFNATMLDESFAYGERVDSSEIALGHSDV